ncbi:hypothetical protein VCHA53O466_50441 [Vibrio chagasii]|nr:hypothetical protein VCHA53O466_50441 [Vibrio chagasii]
MLGGDEKFYIFYKTVMKISFTYLVFLSAKKTTDEISDVNNVEVVTLSDGQLERLTELVSSREYREMLSRITDGYLS